jgi:hypothetical protein
MSSLQSVPIFEQFTLMQFRPRFDHALLSLWQIARNQFNGINSINSASF